MGDGHSSAAHGVQVVERGLDRSRGCCAGGLGRVNGRGHLPPELELEGAPDRSVPGGCLADEHDPPALEGVRRGDELRNVPGEFYPGNELDGELSGVQSPADPRVGEAGSYSVVDDNVDRRD